MNILFISAWFPYPPDNGARCRTYNLIKGLSRKHNVFLVSLMQDDSRPEDAQQLADICKVVSLHESKWFRPGTVKSVMGLFSSRPRSFVCTFDPSIKLAVKQAIEQLSPDVVVASTLGVVEYVPDNCPVPVVLEEHNCEFAVLRRSAERMSGALRRLRYNLGWKKFARWEAAVWRRFSTVTMVSEEDRRLTMQMAPDLARVFVVPNGVDIEHYKMRPTQPQGQNIVYNGAMTYSANLNAVRDYARDIYPALQGLCPAARLLVTGRTTRVDLSGIEDCPGIEMTGYVPDIRSVLSGSAVAAVPLREGGGSRLKILEAMAAGVPVVTTTMGAEGIRVTSGKHLLIADDPVEFAKALAQLLLDRKFAATIARSARDLVEENYSWSLISAWFTSIVESSVGGPTPSTELKAGY